MKFRHARQMLPLLFILPASASQAALPDTPSRALPEEVVITGAGDLVQLRMQMIEAEKRAYDVFNRFNDEKRFQISCSTSQPTGTRFNHEICAPEFQIEATSNHAAMVLESFSKMREGLASGIPLHPGPLENFVAPVVPMEAVIAAQQGAYQRKLREVAEQHPEFLNALIEYTQLRGDYESSVGRAAPAAPKPD